MPSASKSFFEFLRYLWISISLDDLFASLYVGLVWFVKGWFRHVYPASFLMVSLVRLGSVASGIYTVLAVGLVIASSWNPDSEPASWWKAHKYIDSMSILWLVVSFVCSLFCSGASSDVLDYLKAIGFGVDIRDQRKCSLFFGVAPELILCFAGLVNFTTRLCVDRSIFRVATDRKNMRLRDYIFVGGLLIVSTSMHCNVFSAAHHAAIISTLLLFCSFSIAPRRRGAILRKFSQFLLLVGSVHILTFFVIRFATLASTVPTMTQILLGSEDNARCGSQCLLSFIAVGLLLRSAPHLALSQDAASEKSIAGERTSELIGTKAHVVRDTETTIVQRQQRQPITRILKEASPRCRGETNSSQTSHSLHDWFLGVLIFIVEGLGSSGILMIKSLIIWCISWPSLAALPFLLMSLYMLHKSIHSIPQSVLVGVLLYQGFGSLLLYSYNVFLTATEAPPSKVPNSYTWAERCCLQNFSGGYEAVIVIASSRERAILGQAFATLLFALNVVFLRHASFLRNYFASEPAFEDRSDIILKWLTSFIRFWIYLLRIITVGVILLYMSFTNSFSLVTVGYVLWLLCLAGNGFLVPTDVAGYDSLRGDPWVWYALLYYTNAIIVLRYFWVVMVDSGSDLIGTTRGLTTITRTSGDFLLAVLACAQTRSIEVKILQPRFLMSHTSLVGRVFCRFGIFWQLGVLFFIVMSPPISADSFVFLCLFNVTVAIEYFLGHEYSGRNQFLLVSASIAAAVMLARSVLLVPPVEAEVLPLLDNSLRKILAIERSYDVNRKVAAIVVILFTSLSLNRVACFSTSTRTRARKNSQSYFCTPKCLANLYLVLEAVARWSHRGLLIAAFFLMDGHGALPTIQLLVLMGMLVSGQFRDRVGLVISIYCVTLLCLQYLHRFDFKDGVSWLSDENGKYWGLSWNPELVTAEVALLLLAIIQSTVQREAKQAEAFCWDMDVQLFTGSKKLKLELIGYGPHIAACSLILIAVLANTVWSLLGMLLIFGFVLSGASREKLPAARSKLWLTFFSIFLVLSLVCGWGLQLWLPPGYPDKPSDDEISGWIVCSMFDNSTSIDEEGAPCTHYSPNGGYCGPQRMHCAKTWRIWMGDQKHFGYTVCEFLLLFTISNLRQACTKALDESTESKPIESTASCASASATEKPASTAVSNASAAKVVLDLDDLGDQQMAGGDQAKLEAEQPRSGHPRVILDLDTFAQRWQSDTTCESGGQEPKHVKDVISLPLDPTTTAKGSLGVMGSKNSSSSMRNRLSARGFTASAFGFRWGRAYHYYRGCEIMFWISLASAFMSQQEVDAISVSYILLLLFHLHREHAHTAEHPFESRMTTLRHIRLFNLAVFIMMTAYQCPSFPCAYELRSLSDRTTPRAYFSAPLQCNNAYTNHVDAWGAADTDEERLLGLGLRCIGLKKKSPAFGMGSGMGWNLLVFAFGLAQHLVSSRWRAELTEEFERHGERLDWYEAQYRKHLTEWRFSELDRSLIKTGALLTKLNHLIFYLNEIRKLWMDQRKAFTPEEEYDRNRLVRILDLSLEAGVKRSLVDQTLKDFEEPFYQHLEKDAIRTPLDERTVKLLNRYVLEQVALEEKYTLRYMTEQDKEAQKRMKLKELFRLADALGKSPAAKQMATERLSETNTDAISESLRGVAEENPSDEMRPSPRTAPCRNIIDVDTYEDVEKDASRQCLAGHTLAKFLAEKFDQECPICKTTITLNAEVFACRICQYEICGDCYKKGDSDKENEEQEHEQVSRIPYEALQERYHQVKEFVGYYIDDILYFDQGHECLWTHRQGNSLLDFMMKLAWSQTLAILIFACSLQFAVYQSIAALVNIVSTLLSLMAFPHPSRWFWRALQVYNIFLVTLKMLYQLPLFCGDGEHFFYVSKCNLEKLPVSVPTEVVFGFLKIRPRSSSQDTYSFTSVFQAFWADMLVCALLFIHWDRLANGGRLGNPQEICKDMETDLIAHIPDFSRPRSIDEDPEEVWGERHATLEKEETIVASERFQTAEATSSSAIQTEYVTQTEQLPDDKENVPKASPLVTCLKSCPNIMTEITKAFMHLVVDSARLPKPVCNLYGQRLLCSSGCFLIILVFWQNLTGTGQSIYDSISENEFSLAHAWCVVLFLALMIIDRVLYTSYMQKDFDEDEVTAMLSPDKERFDLEDKTRTEIISSTRSTPAVIQKVFLLAEIVTLHVLCIWNWGRAEITEIQLSMFSNPTLAAFYFLFIAYLALTALQQQYDISVTKGGLGFTHSTDTVSWLLFKVYQVVPFLEELRVLSDWTATRTSLNFMMWMKLEDANQALYETQVDMDYRRTFAEGEIRPLYEKVFQGGLFIIALFILIVGPLLYFSPLVSGNGVASSVAAGTFSVKLITDITTVTLYESGGGVIQDLGYDEMSEVSRRYTSLPSADNARLQSLTFPVSSASAWFPTLRQQLIERFDQPEANMFLVFSMGLRLDGTTIGSWRDSRRTVQLEQLQLQKLQRVLNASDDASEQVHTPLEIADAWPTLVYVSSDTSGQDKQLGAYIPADLTFKPAVTMPYWSLTKSIPECENPSNTTDCRFAVKVVSSKRTSPGSIAGTSTIIGLYLGIVYTIGRFLRLVFQGQSKKVIYTELQDTALLRDLCNGIYICRIHGRLKDEYNLYYQLLSIYRNPMLLLEVSKASGAWQRSDDTEIETQSNQLRRSIPPMRESTHSFTFDPDPRHQTRENPQATDSAKSVASASMFARAAPTQMFSRTVTKFLPWSHRNADPPIATSDSRSETPPPTERPSTKPRQQWALGWAPRGRNSFITV